MVAASPASTAKGSNFIGLLKSLEKLHGAEARQRALSLLPPEIAPPFTHGQVIAIGWYPVTWYAELHAAIDRAVGGGAKLARTLGHNATVSDFSGVHRLVASVLSVETVFGQTHRLMGLYWKGGTVERVELSPGQARLRFSNWIGFNRLVWEDIMGSTEGILSFCGATNIRCRPTGSVDAAHTVDLELRWS